MNGCVLRIVRPIAVVLGLGLSLSSVAGSATAADLAPHRALYTLSLERNDGGSGVTAASGTMAYELGETCEAWTVEQRYRLKMGYSEVSRRDDRVEFGEFGGQERAALPLRP